MRQDVAPGAVGVFGVENITECHENIWQDDKYAKEFRFRHSDDKRELEHVHQLIERCLYTEHDPSFGFYDCL